MGVFLLALIRAMSSEHSVSQWIVSLKQGELAAVQKLWDRFKAQLFQAAKKKLGSVPKVLNDEDDIAQTVLIAIWRGAAAGRFEDVRNRDDLWWTLLKITKWTVANSVDHDYAQRRGGGHKQEVLSFEELVSNEPTQEFICILDDLTTNLLKKLRNNELRKIAKLRIYGYTPTEISTRMSLPQRSTERKLQMIRNTWSEELERVGT